MPIKILYDEGGFYEPHGGVSRYFAEIMKRLGDYGCSWRLPLVNTENINLLSAPFSLPRPRQTVRDFVRVFCGGHCPPGVSHVYRMLARLFPGKFPSGEFANIQAVDKALKEGRFDIYHPTAPHLIRGSYKKYLGNRPMVVTVHDLIPEVIGDNLRVRKNRKQVLDRANAVIAVSENTKKDILRLYDIPEEKIHVIYHGYVGHVGEEDVRRFPIRDLVPESPYIVFVGKRSGYKNFNWFLRAIVPLLRKGLGLICTGLPFSRDEQLMLENEGVSDRVWQKFYSDDEMGLVLRHALAFVYPSVYEGFGIPILDAFANQCPVILSRASCFPEVAGAAALYFDLGDAVGLQDQIIKLLEDGCLRQNLIEKGRRRKSLFSWEKCVSQTVAVYQKVLSVSSF